MSEATPRWVAVVLAAGQGTRMRSSTPKVAHPLAGRPVVRHVVEAARAAGVEDIVIVVGAGAESPVVRDAAGEGVRFAVQPTPLGTGHAVECARGAAGDADFVLILNGDVPLVLPATLRRLMASVESADDGAVSTGFVPSFLAGERPHARPDFAVLTACVPVEAYGVLELEGHSIASIIETKGEGDVDRRAARYINSGQYAARAEWLWSRLEHIDPAPNGERYLTLLAAIAHGEGNAAVAVEAEEAAEVRGINDRVQLAEAEATIRDRIRRRHMLAGVTIADPSSAYIDADVTIGEDTVILPQTHLQGATVIGMRCEIGPATIIRDSTLGELCVVRSSTIEESVLEDGVDVGPYSHLRPGSHLCEGVHIGNYAEVKASRLGRGAKMGHFSYIGDADVGADVNIGAGTITANYDGTQKHRTVIGDGAFIGSDTMIVAPVRIGAGARTSAGSVVTRDVPDGMLAVGAPARIRRQAEAGTAFGSLGAEQEEPD